jgi:glycosyltransferase involved in cell wall biosynthesis
LTASADGARAPGPHVAYVVRSWPRLSQTFVLDEVLALQRLGLRLEIFALSRSDEALTQPEVALVRAPVTYLDRPASGDHLRVLLPAPGRYLRTAWYVAGQRASDRGYRVASRASCFAMAVRLSRRLRAARRAGRPPARLHAHFAHDPALVALLAHRLTGLPWSFTAHARDLWQVPTAALADRVASADLTVACCRAGADRLRALMPAALRGRVRLVHHGVDVEVFQPGAPGARRSRPHRIVSVGRLVAKKGFGDLLAACRLLKDRQLPFRLDVYGDGPLRDRLAAEVERLDLAAEVRLAGARPRRDLAGLLQEADVFAITPLVTEDGDRDGIPNVLLEAMACGLPAVATAVGGIPEVVIDGANGLLTPARDAGAVADRLAALLADQDARTRLGRAARRTVLERFDARAASSELATLLTSGGAAPGGTG